MKAQSREKIIERLAKIAEGPGGLQPDTVIEDAKNKTSPLHGEFNWDVNEAAQEHWREQARALIRSVHALVTVESVSILVPTYVRDPDAPPNVQGYIPYARLKTDAERAMEVLIYEMERAASAVKRARDIAAGLGMSEDFDRLLDEMVTLKSKVESAA